MLAQSKELCRIFPSFDFLIRHCTRRFLVTAQREVRKRNQAANASARIDSTNELLHDNPLSHCERARLHRGFLRYSALQSLMHTPGKFPFHNKNVSAKQAAAIFTEFTPWEVEEIACVHQYFIDSLKEVLNEVEDHFIESVASGSSRSRYLPQDKNADLQLMEAELEFCDDRKDVMFLDSEKPRHPLVKEYLAILGFPFLRTLFKADNNRRNILIAEQ